MDADTSPDWMDNRLDVASYESLPFIANNSSWIDSNQFNRHVTVMPRNVNAAVLNNNLLECQFNGLRFFSCVKSSWNNPVRNLCFVHWQPVIFSFDSLIIQFDSIYLRRRRENMKKSLIFLVDVEVNYVP